MIAQRRARAGITVAVLIASLLPAACASTPIVLSAQFTPPAGSRWAVAATAPTAGACRVELAGFSDERSDPQAMGDMLGRPVRADTMAWLRSGFQMLARDTQILLIDGPNADLVLHVSVLKAYLMTETAEKSANVVVRIRYERHDAPVGDSYYRGTDKSVNFANAPSEAQGTIDAALADLLDRVAKDIVGRCRGTAAISARKFSLR